MRTAPTDDWRAAFFAALTGTAASDAELAKLTLRAAEIADAAVATIMGRIKAAETDGEVEKSAAAFEQGTDLGWMPMPRAIAIRDVLLARGRRVHIETGAPDVARVRPTL